MAFSTFLRRAASSATPLLCSLSCATSRPLLRRPFSLLSSPAIPRLSSPFSSLAKPSTDSSLLRVIESEIKCAEECDDHDRVEEIPEGFPFQIEDEKGMNIIRLKRTYQGKEKIEVLVSMPSLVTGEEAERDENGEEGDDETGDGLSQSHIPITVRVCKDGAGPTLEFACTAYPDEVVIDSMSVIENQGDEEEMIAYEGPDFK